MESPTPDGGGLHMRALTDCTAASGPFSVMAASLAARIVAGRGDEVDVDGKSFVGGLERERDRPAAGDVHAWR